VIPETASTNRHRPIEPGLDEIGEGALGEHPPLAAFSTPPRVRHRRSRHHHRAFYDLIGAELGQ
jgi:hypothetical protein